MAASALRSLAFLMRSLVIVLDCAQLVFMMVWLVLQWGLLAKAVSTKPRHPQNRRNNGFDATFMIVVLLQPLRANTSILWTRPLNSRMGTRARRSRCASVRLHRRCVSASYTLPMPRASTTMLYCTPLLYTSMRKSKFLVWCGAA